MSEAQPSKAIRMLQAQEAVGRIKAMEGESQPSTDVDLFVSIEKVMVLNTGLQEIMMDHALRSISYIADIDNILVVMAKRSLVLSSPSSGDEQSTLPSNAQQKLICHIFETDEAHLIAQSIGQAFQRTLIFTLKIRRMKYSPAAEIMHDELETFTKKDRQKDVIVPKSKGEA
ncbi:APBA1 [Bugula neritina]|uniref:APBA1 n=1 Tax=Bugula neritina TaxID=10212 RepID=A0A7J7JTW9_BUGNE|nr:APBA1 [Bugula neritina]